MWQEIVKVSAVLAGGVLVFILNRILAGFFSRWPLLPFWGIGKYAEMKREIRDRLIELTTLTDAGRTYIVLFHNGKDFRIEPGSKQFTFKTRCFEEYVGPGISGAARSIIDNATANDIIPSLLSVVTGAVENDCIVTAEANNLAPGQDKLLRASRYVCVQSLPESRWKNYLLEQGANGIGFCFLLNPDNENVTGFIISEWLSDQYKDHGISPEFLFHMPHYAANISYTVAELKQRFPVWHRWL